MLYSEIITVCSIHTKHINAICGNNVEILKLNLVIPEVTTRLERVKFVKYPFLWFLVCYYDIICQQTC
jgi:hypothetical protein